MIQGRCSVVAWKFNPDLQKRYCDLVTGEEHYPEAPLQVLVQWQEVATLHGRRLQVVLPTKQLNVKAAVPMAARVVLKKRTGLAPEHHLSGVFERDVKHVYADTNLRRHVLLAPYPLLEGDLVTTGMYSRQVYHHPPQLMSAEGAYKKICHSQFEGLRNALAAVCRDYPFMRSHVPEMVEMSTMSVPQTVGGE